MPSINTKGCKPEDREGENACADLQPLWTRMRGAIRLDRDCGNCGLNRCLQFTDEAIASPGKRFDKAWGLCRVAQHLPDLVDGGIQVAFDIHKRVRPQALLQLFPHNHVARPLQKDSEHLEWLPAELQLHAILA